MFHTKCDCQYDVGGLTYLDSIYSHLEDVGICDDDINKLKEYFISEQFDTECIDLDLSLYSNSGRGGNIDKAIESDDCIKCIKNMFDKATRIIYIYLFTFYLLYIYIFVCLIPSLYYLVKAGTFSVGIDFKYDDLSKYRLIKDHHALNEYSVLPRFKNFKSEIHEYDGIDNIIAVYKNEIYPKAVTYYNTALAKSITASRYGVDYGMISIDCLLSIILYTDYTKLSSNFSATFRSHSIYEPIKATNKRNSHYYWLAKNLKTTIAIYGQRYYAGVGFLEALRGPFYCGMNWVLNMTQFNIQLLSPTSTTKAKEVATRFGGPQGMIIKFQNNTGYGRKVKGFDVSWISRYGPQEDER